MFAYFKSREFFLTILAMMLISILGYLFVFFVFLPSYTEHGESVLVPDVSKIPYKEAEKKLEDAGFRIETRDSVYMPDLPPLTVIKQYPSPLTSVKPDRTILLTLNKIVPPTVKLPALLDMSVYQAKSQLESHKLMLKDIKKIPDIARNMVLKVMVKGKEIKEGTELPQGTGVTLVVGEGGAIVFQKEKEPAKVDDSKAAKEAETTKK